MYKVEVDMKWRDHIDHSKIQNKIKTFTGRDKADVYSYIKYYTLAFGICDVVLIEDGVFHRVHAGMYEELYFVCVFDGRRSH